MPIAKIDGGEIHYATSGEGAPVAMLLPQSGGPLGPDAFLGELARHFMTVRYDPLGSGKSAPVRDAGAVTMPARAGEVSAVLDSLGIERAHLCCHSTGCGIGLALAAAAPGRVAGLVLIAPWTHGDRHLTVMQNLRVAAARALRPEDYERFNASLLFPPAFRRAHAAGFDRLAEEAAAQDADRIAERLNGILAFDARPILPGIAAPTLVVTAEDDQLMPAWFGREMARDIPGAELIELAMGGHMLPETQGAGLALRVADFLARIAPDGTLSPPPSG